LAAVFVAVGGLVASGKSTLARALAARIGAEWVDADRVRESLLGDRWARSFDPGFEDEVYVELLRRAESAIDSGHLVVLDACFPLARHRVAARALAQRHAQPFLFVECRVSAETTRERLAARDALTDHPGWEQIYRDLAAHWQPVRELAPDEHLVLETDRPFSENEAAFDAHLAMRLAGARSEQGRARMTKVLSEKPEAVTFDCWNTLLYEDDWKSAHALRVEALERAAREAGRVVSSADAGRAFDAAWERHMQLWRDGVATGSREVALWALGALGLREPHPALEHLVAVYEEASHSSRVEALAGALDTLLALERLGVRRALVCDTGLTPGRVVRRHLDRLGLLELLEVQIFSDEVGVPKPDPHAFQSALHPLGVAPGRALHVGDLLATDVAGARALGMRTVRIHARHDDASELPEADFVVGSHAELLQVLGIGTA
jgi:FMN phosphatase YigB (HAD superfamily)/predicted kinase